MKTTKAIRNARLVSFILTVVSVIAIFATSASAASYYRSYITDGEYSIRLHDDLAKCVNVIYASTEEDRAQLGVDPYNDQLNEIWIITHRGNNYYTLSPKHAPHLCMNALLANKTPGDKVVLHGYTPNDAASLWSFHSNGDGSYTIKNKATGLVLDLTNGDYTVGNRFIHWTSNNYLRAQGYYLRKVNSAKWEYPMRNAYCTWRSYSNMSWGSYNNNSGNRDYHLGIDIYGSGGRVYAASAGTVVAYSTSNSGANGRYVVISHTIDGKTVYSFYAHLKSVNVYRGQSVTTDTQIGVAGGSGYGRNNYYGTHLHFAIIDSLNSSGSYYGYSTRFSGNKTTYSGRTFYNPVYVINYDKLP